MPELPEVETVVRGLRPQLIGQRIQSVWLDWPPSLVTPDSAQFQARIAGQTIQSVERRAKYIVIGLTSDWLMIHLKMTGRLYVLPDSATNEADQWVHFRFQLDNETRLCFSDARKFGRVYLTAALEPYLGHLGPEPLEDAFTLEQFQGRLAGRKSIIKPLLLNQAFIAGVGNIYADEALHMARIHPTRKSDSLNMDEISRLYSAIREALNKGIERQGASIGWYRQANGERGTMQDAFYAYGRTGQPCQTCGTALIERMIVGQRSTHYCPNCQI